MKRGSLIFATLLASSLAMLLGCEAPHGDRDGDGGDGDGDGDGSGDGGGAALAGGGGTSCSKLGPHVNGWTSAARQFAYACPPLVKIIGAGGVPIDAIAQLEQRCPDTAVLLRMWTGERWNGDPVADADAFWTKTYGPLVALPVHQRELVDYVEGPNEQDSTPTWPLVPGYRPGYFNAFLIRFAQRASWAGFRPVVGSISVGNPGGDLDTEAVPALREILPAIAAAASAGGGWSYHAYTNNASHAEMYMALRYRAYLERVPELRGVPLFLSEGGFDLGGNPEQDGWRKHLTAQQYIAWLAWFDGELRADPEVVGVTLFSIGAGWPSFDLTPIAGGARGARRGRRNVRRVPVPRRCRQHVPLWSDERVHDDAAGRLLRSRRRRRCVGCGLGPRLLRASRSLHVKGLALWFAHVDPTKVPCRDRGHVAGARAREKAAAAATAAGEHHDARDSIDGREAAGRRARLVADVRCRRRDAREARDGEVPRARRTRDRFVPDVRQVGGSDRQDARGDQGREPVARDEGLDEGEG